MHNLGCPKRNNPYADCECVAMEQREHTEQLRRYNDNAPTAELVSQLQSEVGRLTGEITELLYMVRTGATNEQLVIRLSNAKSPNKRECSICKGNGFLDVEKYYRVEQEDCKWCGTTGIEPQPPMP